MMVLIWWEKQHGALFSISPAVEVDKKMLIVGLMESCGRQNERPNETCKWTGYGNFGVSNTFLLLWLLGWSYS
jgi:hypothetical protein